MPPSFYTCKGNYISSVLIKEFFEMHWVEAMNKSNKLRERAMLARNEKFQDLWHKLADDLELKYFAGQPWLRTYDGTWK